MNNMDKKYSLTKEGLLVDLNTFQEKEAEAAYIYAKSAEKLIDENDQKVLMSIARDEETHAAIVKNLIRLVEDNYHESEAGE